MAELDVASIGEIVFEARSGAGALNGWATREMLIEGVHDIDGLEGPAAGDLLKSSLDGAGFEEGGLNDEWQSWSRLQLNVNACQVSFQQVDEGDVVKYHDSENVAHDKAVGAAGMWVAVSCEQ
ncbi:hypothetical protein ATC03_13790 [Agromyces aureus]|uniref:Uncharacterized protein n=1 Tax=Agromyces aureus TaxID=453304 RepID=A0A191WH46_9MICO|nr:hypothetical protein ATC03_13790 [Agromyces aureus]